MACLAGVIVVGVALAALLDEPGDPRPRDPASGVADAAPAGSAGSETGPGGLEPATGDAPRMGLEPAPSPAATEPAPDAAAPLAVPEAADTSREPRHLMVTPRDPFGDAVHGARVTWRYEHEPEEAFRRWHGNMRWNPAAGEAIVLRARLQGWGRIDDVVRWDTWDGSRLQLVLGADVDTWGNLRDKADRPLVNETVQLLLRGRAQPAPPVRSGPAGRFPVRVDPARVVGGRMLATFSWEEQETVGLVPLEVVDEHTLTLRRVELSQHVFLFVDDAGRPLTEAFAPGRRREVDVLADPPDLSGPAVVDPGGRVLVLLTGEGPATLRFVTDRHRSAPVPVTRSEGRKPPMRTVPLLETGGYTGVLRDADGRPVVGAWVTRLDDLAQLDTLGWPALLDAATALPEPPPEVARSSADGRFFGLPHAPGTLVVLHPRFRPLLLPVGGVADDLALVLDAGLELRVRRPDGVPPDARLEIERPPTPGDPVRARRVTFDADGLARVPALSAGAHTLRLVHDRELLGVEEVELADGAEAVEHTLRTRPVHRWTVRVPARLGVQAVRIVPVDAAQGAVAVGARVETADAAGDGESVDTFVVQVPWSGPADLAVRRHVPDVPPERVGWQTWSPVQVAGDVTRDLAPPAGSLRVGLDLPAHRAPFRVEVIDPLAPGAPVLAAARLERAGDAREFSGLAPGFYRVDVLEADDPVRPGGAFVGQVTTALTANTPARVRVTEHDGAQVQLAVHVSDAAGRPLSQAEVQAQLVDTRLARTRTSREGKARLKVPAGVRGVVVVRDGFGRELARAAYQSPGTRPVRIQLEGGEGAEGEDDEPASASRR